jgi:hypothetical protein
MAAQAARSKAAPGSTSAEDLLALLG